MSSDGIKIIAENRKARHDYFIEDTFEAGIVLKGTEVKSLRDGRANLKDAYARIINGEIWVINMHISPYSFAYYNNHDPRRQRKLLLHGREIKKLFGKVNEMGYALVPLRLYFKRGKAKVLLGLVKGKKKHDKRDAIRQRDQDRELARERRRYT